MQDSDSVFSATQCILNDYNLPVEQTGLDILVAPNPDQGHRSEMSGHRGMPCLIVSLKPGVSAV